MQRWSVSSQEAKLAAEADNYQEWMAPRPTLPPPKEAPADSSQDAVLQAIAALSQQMCTMGAQSSTEIKQCRSDINDVKAQQLDMQRKAGVLADSQE